MKKLHLKYNCFFAVVLTLTIFLFIGCSKETKYQYDKFVKYKSLTLESLHDVLSRVDFYISDLSSFLKKAYNYNGDTTDEALSNTYMLGFHLQIINGNLKGRGFGLVVQPCEYDKKYDDYTKYPFHSGGIVGGNSEQNESVLSAYFLIENLIDAGYIVENSDEQKDLCMFQIGYTEGMGYKKYISSNDIVYTAEEINAVMDAYEALK